MARLLTTLLDDQPVGWLETLETFRQLEDQQIWHPLGKTVVGTPGDDRLHGGKGSDDIDGLAGADTMAGRLGDDTFHVDNAGDVVKEHAGEGTDTVIASLDWKLGHDVENLTLTGWEDFTGIGNGLDNVILGNIGENLLDGGTGNDRLESGGLLGPLEGDTLIGGLGDDTLIGGLGPDPRDVLLGGDGDDVMQVSEGENTLSGGDGNDHLTGGTGGGFHSRLDTLKGEAGQDTLDGGGYVDGGAGRDEIHPVWAWEVLGGTGDDTITGTGGAGYDDLTVDAGAGDDSVSVMAMNNSLFLYGADGNDILSGSAMLDVTIDAGAGNDVVTSKGGQYGGSSTVNGGEGNDTIDCATNHGTAYADGGAGDDVLQGSSTSGGELHLAGGLGSDTLFAGAGVRYLGGGADADRFVLTVREILGIDTAFIGDFSSGLDRLLVSQGSLPVGNGDLVVDGAVSVSGPGGFDAGAELVIVTADLADLSLTEAAAAIGSANQAYAVGQTAVFMVDDGSNSWALYFQSSGADATVSAAELSVIGRLDGTASTAIDDIVWTA